MNLLQVVFLRTRVFSFDEIGSVRRFSTIDSNNPNILRSQRWAKRKLFAIRTVFLGSAAA